MRLAVVLAIVFGVSSSCLAQQSSFSQKGDSRWIALASRQTEDEAIGVARAYRFQLPTVRVVQATNGWFAVVAGPERVPNAKVRKEQLIREASVPNDMLFSRGDGYVREVWAPPKPQFDFELEYDGKRPLAAQLGESRFGVSSRKVDGNNIAGLTITQPDRPLLRFELDEATASFPNAKLVALRLDATSNDHQLVFSSFWGGAHCCTVTKFIVPQNGSWQAVPGKTADGDNGYSFEDVDGDGAAELIHADNTFLYRYTYYAASVAPTRVSRLSGTRVVDITLAPASQRYMRQSLYRLEHWAAKNPESWRSNGFLAAWVATKAVVGEFDDAWSRMLSLYDRSSDWPLTECTVEKVKDACPPGREITIDFPTALRKHLEEERYIPRSVAQAPASTQVAAVPSPSAPPVPPPTTQPAVTKTSSGTGFFVGTTGQVITNAHVVEGCTDAKVRGRSVPEAAARIVARDSINDLALLISDYRNEKQASVRMTARLGEPVAAFGFPLTQVLATSGNFTLGNITALAGIGDDTRYIQISAPIQPGNSGGPLLDEQGNIVGVVTAKLNALKTLVNSGDVPQNVNFAIRATGLVAFLQSNGITVDPVGKTAKLLPPDLADEAANISVQVTCNAR